MDGVMKVAENISSMSMYSLIGAKEAIRKADEEGNF